MKTRISVQERLKDLRVERGLNLEELAQETGISKSALGSYENDNDEYKEINHGSLLKLADFYQVSVDYLLGLTNNRKYENTPIEELHLSDEVVELLKSERFNNRLLCEIISHEKFRELLADAEIYVDGIATMHFHDTNSSLAALRAMILEEHPEATADRAIKVLEACQVEEEDFFCHVTHKTWDVILHDIRKAHENDSESAPDTTPADELIREVQKAMQSPGDRVQQFTEIFCKAFRLKSTMATGSKQGMCTLDQCLLEKYKQNLIEHEVALGLMRDQSVISQLQAEWATREARKLKQAR